MILIVYSFLFFLLLLLHPGSTSRKSPSTIRRAGNHGGQQLLPINMNKKCPHLNEWFKKISRQKTMPPTLLSLNRNKSIKQTNQLPPTHRVWFDDKNDDAFLPFRLTTSGKVTNVRWLLFTFFCQLWIKWLMLVSIWLHSHTLTCWHACTCLIQPLCCIFL